jgi:hypothetical protein
MVTLQSSILLQQFFLLFLEIGECLSGLFQYIALFLFLFLDIDECLSSLTYIGVMSEGTYGSKQFNLTICY